MAGYSTKLKYPPKVVLRELEGMLKEARSNEEIIFIGQLFKDKDYSRYTFNKIIRRFNGKIIDGKITKEHSDYGIIKAIVPCKKRITEHIEQNIINRVAQKKLNDIFGMFLLKATHKWVEAQHTLKIQKDINVKYQIEQVPKLTNPALINGNVVDLADKRLNKPNE